MAAIKPPAVPLSDPEFLDLLSSEFAGLMKDVPNVAAAVSGGPDSMALAWLLARWSRRQNKKLHILTVDHGLRSGSGREARQVGEQMKSWPNACHAILRWTPRTMPQTRIQERARAARYALMADYCRDEGIAHLFLAHHMDDQAETFLMRLAAGSGLDGLAAMREVHAHESGLLLLRPFLGIPKARLLATCAANGIPFLEDPSNQSQSYARVRLRNARQALEAEGLSAKRLSLTASRLNRAREALEIIERQEYQSSLFEVNSDRIVLKFDVMAKLPAEISFRVLRRAVLALIVEADYAPRMEKLEALHADLMKELSFQKRTLGAIVFERNDKKMQIRLLKNIDIR